MAVTYLLVHKISYRYIKRVVDYIHARLKNHSPFPVEFMLCDDINTIALEPRSTVYIIGDLFGVFKKTANCKYVFLNFSVLYVMGNPFHCSLYAYKTIRKKRNIFKAKLKCYDYVLDYWPTQTAVLQKKINIPVTSFPVAVEAERPSDNDMTSQRKYDVCFVGSMSRRRKQLIEKMEALGFTMPPTKNVIFEDMAAISKIVLNVHAHRSNHLEIPRIIGAFASKSCLVTESNNANMEEMFPGTNYVACPFHEITARIQDLLTNPKQIDKMADGAYEWFGADYLVQSELAWKNLIAEIHTHFYGSTQG